MSEPVVSSRPESPVERKRLRILQAADQCFASQGFAKTTVADIARIAGVSKGLVYVHFRGKEELRDVVLEQTLEEWSCMVRGEIERRAEDVCETLAIMHRASLDYARSHPILRQILTGDTGVLLTRTDEAVRKAFEEWRLGLIDLLSKGRDAGEVRQDIAVEPIADVFRLLHLSFLERLFQPGSIDVENENLLDASIQVLLRGICAPPS